MHRLVGNDDGSVEILQSLHEVGPMSTHIGTEREHCMHICQYLLNQYEAEGDSFLDCIITGDVLSPLRAGVKRTVNGVAL